MHYIKHALDRPDALATRLANYDRRKAYLAQAKIKTGISGPMVADANETRTGSCFPGRGGQQG